ncbi:hypothetical protein OC844_000394 [Tilletia horrida]|nr:hypothetical protein OC844_000394 [Tilletia horrida]
MAEVLHAHRQSINTLLAAGFHLYAMPLVIVCATCQTAIEPFPDKFRGHLSKVVHLSLEPQKLALQDAFEELRDDLEFPRLDALPAPPRPLPQLLTRPGFVCAFDQCDRIFSKLTSLRSHHTSTHGSVGQHIEVAAQGWTPCSATVWRLDDSHGLPAAEGPDTDAVLSKLLFLNTPDATLQPPGVATLPMPFVHLDQLKIARATCETTLQEIFGHLTTRIQAGRAVFDSAGIYAQAHDFVRDAAATVGMLVFGAVQLWRVGVYVDGVPATLRLEFAEKLRRHAIEATSAEELVVSLADLNAALVDERRSLEKVMLKAIYDLIRSEVGASRTQLLLSIFTRTRSRTDALFLEANVLWGLRAATWLHIQECNPAATDRRLVELFRTRSHHAPLLKILDDMQTRHREIANDEDPRRKRRKL